MQRVIKIMFFVSLLCFIVGMAHLYVAYYIETIVHQNDSGINMGKNAITMLNSLDEDISVVMVQKARKQVADVMKGSEKKRAYIIAVSDKLVWASWALLVIPLFSSLPLFFVMKRCSKRRSD